MGIFFFGVQVDPAFSSSGSRQIEPDDDEPEYNIEKEECQRKQPQCMDRMNFVLLEDIGDDEYIAFMKKYEDSDGTDLSILLDYTKFMTNLTEYTDKMESLEDDMTVAETFYYIEVMNRCNEKMMKELN